MGRRKLVMGSLVGVVIALGLLSFSCHQAALDSPPISPGPFEPQPSLQCPLLPAGGEGRSGKASCMSCLGANCGFCAAAGDEVRQRSVFITSTFVRLCRDADFLSLPPKGSALFCLPVAGSSIRGH
jgi:hypothetical protein